MILIKQLVQKSIEKYQEGKLSGKEPFKLYYFAYGLSYAFLKINNQINLSEPHFQIRNLVYRTLFNDLVKTSYLEAPININVKYNEISSRLKKDFQILVDNDVNVIAKFLDETAQLQSGEESYGTVHLSDDSLGIIESSYPE